MARDHALQFFFQQFRVSKIAHTNRTPRNLVLISRADAAFGGAKRLVAERFFHRSIERLVHGQNQRGIFRQYQILRRNINALFAQACNFLDQMPRIDDNAIADH